MDDHHFFQRILKSNSRTSVPKKKNEEHCKMPCWLFNVFLYNPHSGAHWFTSENREHLTFTGMVFLSLITRPSSITDCIRETALSMFLSIRSSLDWKSKQMFISIYADIYYISYICYKLDILLIQIAQKKINNKLKTLQK